MDDKFQQTYSLRLEWAVEKRLDVVIIWGSGVCRSLPPAVRISVSPIEKADARQRDVGFRYKVPNWDIGKDPNQPHQSRANC